MVRGLIGETRYSSVFDVLSVKGADCDTDRYVVVANVRHRLSVSKQAAKRCGTQTTVYQVKNSNRFATSETLDDDDDDDDNDVDIRRA
jgi:hypothetical protein